MDMLALQNRVNHLRLSDPLRPPSLHECNRGQPSPAAEDRGVQKRRVNEKKSAPRLIDGERGAIPSKRLLKNLDFGFIFEITNLDNLTADQHSSPLVRLRIFFHLLKLNPFVYFAFQILGNDTRATRSDRPKRKKETE